MILIAIWAVVVVALVIVAIIKLDEAPPEKTEVYDEWLKERIEQLRIRLDNQKKYLKHLDEKRLQSVVGAEQYEKEFEQILMNINEITEEMDNLGLFGEEE